MRKKIKIDYCPKGITGTLYNTTYGRIILKILTKPFVSKLGGLYMNSKLSKLMIKSFIRKNNINMDEYEIETYNCYNDFFTRRIKKDKRPISINCEDFISPCDSKLTVYKINESSLFNIKDSFYSIKDLIGNNEIYKDYIGGMCLIFRLAVDDYHRYCYIDNGYKGKNIHIKGEFHTVQPVALNNYNIYKRNTREYTVLHTDNFNDVIHIEVGALMVGKIKNYHQEYTFKKGEEKGMFLFGGSTIVLLVKKDTVLIDDEIMENTKNGFETVVKYGEKIGIGNFNFF